MKERKDNKNEKNHLPLYGIGPGLSEIHRTLKTGRSFYSVVYTKEWLDKLSYTEKGFKKYGLGK